jgi:hypothetical protein
MPLPPEDEKLPPQIEIALSSMMAQAAAQVNAQAAQQAAMQQAQQQAQDPVIQMQQQELMLRQEELKLKAQKIMLDASAMADKQELEQERVKGDLQLRAMKTQSDIEKDKAMLVAQQEREGVRMGIDIAKAKAQEAQQRRKETPTK